MKKIICLVLVVFTLFSFTACSGKEDVVLSNVPGIDVDLATLSSTVVYAEVYNMVSSPSVYMGKIVRMKGQFAVYQDPNTEAFYYAIVISDATACCSQGIEFVLADAKYPEDYPEIGTEATVKGEFNTYEEGGMTYCQLINAELVDIVD